MNKTDLIRKMVKQLFEQGDVEVVDSSFVEGYVAHYGDKKHSGQKFVK